MAMNPDIKARWVEALRSGKYLQGKRKLKQPTPDGTQYCCLGVLCELAPAGMFTTKDHAYFNYPPSEVTVWANLPCPNPTVTDGFERNGLANLNDSGHTFMQIAQLIEGQL